MNIKKQYSNAIRSSISAGLFIIADEHVESILVKLYHAKLQFFVCYMGASKTDCEDILQDVWLTVYRKIRRLKKIESFSVWLYKITRHQTIYFFRKKRIYANIADDNNLDSLPSKVNFRFYKEDVSKLYEVIDK